jgi:hypothetical protein
MKKKTSIKKYEDGGPKKTKTKVYSEDGNYVKKTVTRPNLIGKGSVTKEKTRRTVKGFFDGAPNTTKMNQYASEYKNVQGGNKEGSGSKEINMNRAAEIIYKEQARREREKQQKKTTDPNYLMKPLKRGGTVGKSRKK